MQTKLTLRLEEELVEQARAYAKRRGKSVSQLVADYFEVLGETPEVQPLAPVTRSLKGMLHASRLDEDDYHRYLEEKHL